MKHLLELITLISLDNNIPMKPIKEIEFPGDCDCGFDWGKLDKQASTLSVVQAETFCCGEHDEMHSLVEKTGFHELKNALNEIFDGYLSALFFDSTPPTEEQNNGQRNHYQRDKN